jgi:hypothetical protein
VARIAQGPRVVLVAAGALLGLNLVEVWLMTVAAPPFHGVDLLSIAKAALIMALVNVPLGLLVPPRGLRTA